MRAASDLLSSHPVDLVLSNTHLSDELASACWQLWPVFRLPRSFACRSKTAALAARH